MQEEGLQGAELFAVEFDRAFAAQHRDVALPHQFARARDDRDTVAEALYGLKQKLTLVNHAIDPLLESIGKLAGGRVPQVCQGTQEYFRDVVDHLERLGRGVDTLRDTVTTAMSVNLAMITLSENEVTKRLAAYAALVAVPTMIAGIYGMNFKHMPELDWQFGYPMVLAIIAGIDMYLFRRFRKAGWL